jgi:hypothetical protein
LRQAQQQDQAADPEGERQVPAAAVAGGNLAVTVVVAESADGFGQAHSPHGMYSGCPAILRTGGGDRTQ